MSQYEPPRLHELDFSKLTPYQLACMTFLMRFGNTNPEVSGKWASNRVEDIEAIIDGHLGNGSNADVAKAILTYIYEQISKPAPAAKS